MQRNWIHHDRIVNCASQRWKVQSYGEDIPEGYGRDVKYDIKSGTIIRSDTVNDTAVTNTPLSGVSDKSSEVRLSRDGRLIKTPTRFLT